METKAQIINNINQLISFIQQNKKSLHCNFSSYNREILAIKDHFYTIADNLTSEFTEQELYTIESDLLFYYQTLKELIDLIQNPPRTINPIQNNNDLAPVSILVIDSHVIKQEDIDEYTNYIQRRIEGIKQEIEKKRKLQLQHMAEIYQLYNGLADNLTQEMMAMDEKLYDRQTQQHKAMIKNIITDLDGV